MKDGDYMIHILLQEGHSFIDDDGESTISPLIEIASCGKKVYSTSYDNIPTESKSPVVWNEHLFISPIGMNHREMELEKIVITLKNKGFLKDEVLGRYTFDLSQIYFSNENHALEHQWFGMNNPESSDFTLITAIFRVSIAIQAEGDRKYNLTLPDPTALDLSKENLMIPSMVHRKYKQLEIDFIESQELPKMDNFGNTDAYFEMEYCGQKYETKTVEQKHKVASFMQTWKVPIEWPPQSNYLVFRCYDEDTVTDELIGTFILKLTEIDQNENIQEQLQSKDEDGGWCQWHQIMGGPKQKTNSIGKLMNHQPELASTWKGRVLLNIRMYDADSPEMDTSEKSQVNQKVYFKAQKYHMGPQKKFQIQSGIDMGVELQGKYEYKVKISIGEYYLLSDKPLESNKGYNRWSDWLQEIYVDKKKVKDWKNCKTDEEKIKNSIIELPYNSIEEIGDVFIYLMKDEKPVSFFKIAASELDYSQEFLSGGNADKQEDNKKEQQQRPSDHRWCVMREDGAYEEVEAFEAGIIKLQLAINMVTESFPPIVPFGDPKRWRKQPKRLKNVRTVRAYIFMCKDIPSADDDGQSDCYIKVWNQDGINIETKTVKDCLNPIFYECHQFTIEYSVKEEMPPLILNLWDENSCFSKNVYLGRALIDIPKYKEHFKGYDNDFSKPLTQEEIKTIPTPHWYDVKFGNDQSEPTTGQILASFRICPDDQLFTSDPIDKINLLESLDPTDFQVSMNIFGLRDLKSFGLLPIRKPFIKFNIKSLLPQDKAQAVSNLRTQSGKGKDPNYNVILKFSVQMPLKECFSPVLKCEVFDNIFLGLSQPLIGSFGIKLGEIRIEQQKKLDQAKEILNKVLASLLYLKSISKEKAEHEYVMQQKKELSPELKDAIKLQQEKALKQQKTNKTDSVLKKAKTSVVQVEGCSDNDEDDSFTRFTEEAEESKLLQSQHDDERWYKNKKTIKLKEAHSQLKKAKTQYENHFQGDNITRDQQKKQRQAKKEYLKQKVLLEQAQQEDVKFQKKIEKEILKQSGNSQLEFFVLIPQYKKNIDFDVYLEENKPPSSIYQAVGYNDQETIQKLVSQTKHLQEDIDKLKSQKTLTEKMENWAKMKFVSDVSKQQKQNDYLYQAKKYTNLHYRKFYKQELETVKKIFPSSVFQNIDIIRGATRGVKSSFFVRNKKDAYGQNSDQQVVGRFKGLIEVIQVGKTEQNKEELRELKRQIWNTITQIYQKFNNKKLDFTIEDFQKDVIQSTKRRNEFWNALQESYIDVSKLRPQMEVFENAVQIMKALDSHTQCEIRLYMLQGMNLANRDLIGESDPYLKISCGLEYNERDNYVLDNANPEFNKMYSFQATFPGCPTMVISAYDYDDIFGDDLIGTTSIDLEERFFNPQWKSLRAKPIEQRQLKVQTSNLSQGSLSMFLQIFSEQELLGVKQRKKSENQDEGEKNEIRAPFDTQIWNVASEPKKQFQMRIAIYETQGIPSMDIEGTSDVYIETFIEPNNRQKTDTHYRCMDGKASFNYRILLDFEAPRQQTVLHLQAFDRDLFSSNEYICEWTLDLQDALVIAELLGKQVALDKKTLDKKLDSENGKGIVNMDNITIDDDKQSFWISTKALKNKGKDNEEEVECKLKLDVKILTKQLADLSPVGSARSDPNLDPYLYPPVGRMSFTLNPFKMLDQLVSPEFKQKLKRYLCLAIFTVLCFMMLPMLVYDSIIGLFKWLILAIF